MSYSRVFKTGWINFKRNSYLSFAAVGIMTVALILFVGLLGFQFLSSNVVASLEDKVDISVYFEIESDPADILSVKNQVEALDNVTEVEYISRERALEIFRERRGHDPLIEDSLEELGDNPFRASLNIGATDPSEYSTIVSFLENPRFSSMINKIIENPDVIERVIGISGAIRNGALISILILAVIAVLVTFNTIRLTIYSQKQEIEVMRLVGATNWHIRGPYVVEGGYYGIFAGLLALAISYPVTYFISQKLMIFIPEVDIFGYFVSNWWQVMILTLVLGSIMGMVSSMIAIRRHLKV
ncbi:MAG: permease-like cell division protein FtsX [Parcubacteria group bacterium]